MEDNIIWCLRYPNGNFVGVDLNSGGYPYETNIFRVERFRAKNGALEYRSLFPNHHFSVCQIKINIELISQE